MRHRADAVRLDVFAKAREHRVDVNRISGRRRHEDEAVLLGDWQRDEAAGVAIESFESVVVGNRDEAAVSVIAPRMIGT